MKDITETWAQHSSTQRLNNNCRPLVTLLCQEINDQELEKEFMRRVQPLF
jgi:hypothetical protein